MSRAPDVAPDGHSPDGHSPITAARRAGVFRRRGWIGLACVVPAVVLASVSEPWVRAGSALDAVLAGLGWAAFLAGTALRFASTLFVGGRKRKALVTDGPYSLCRNPLYLGSFLVGLSLGLVLGSFTVVGAVLLAAVLWAAGTVRAEETDLHELHGEAFTTYCRAVPRFWPRRASARFPETVEVRWHGLVLEARRFLLWAWLPFVARLVVELRTHPGWPRLLRLP